MKLKNKQTGEIKPAEAREDGIYLYDEITEQWYKYELDLLAKWWEYYEEPKKHYEILAMGAVMEREDAEDEIFRNQGQREIGNYFETKEEAELAVRKLKAWKRLKDKGFRFTLTPGVGSLDVTPGKFQIEINADMPEKWFCCDAVQEDLDTCFGGEE